MELFNKYLPDVENYSRAIAKKLKKNEEDIFSYCQFKFYSLCVKHEEDYSSRSKKYIKSIIYRLALQASTENLLGISSRTCFRHYKSEEELPKALNFGFGTTEAESEHNVDIYSDKHCSTESEQDITDLVDHIKETYCTTRLERRVFKYLSWGKNPKEISYLIGKPLRAVTNTINKIRERFENVNGTKNSPVLQSYKH